MNSCRKIRVDVITKEKLQACDEYGIIGIHILIFEICPCHKDMLELQYWKKEYGVITVGLPRAIEHMAIWEHSQHDIVSGGIVNEGSFRVDKENVWHPDLLYQPSIKSHAPVRTTGKGETLVLPIMPQIQCHCKVLKQSVGWGEISCDYISCSYKKTKIIN